MRILSTSEADLAIAARILRDGGLVALPTETVYGLGADAFNPLALARVFEAKRRPSFDPLIIHIAALDGLERLIDRTAFSAQAAGWLDVLSAALWPGPLTLVLPKRSEVPDLATSGLPSVAVRFPSHPVARRLIELSTGAVAAPSANPFGYLSPTSAQHVVSQLGDRVDCVVDGGLCSVGVESTVVDLCGERPRILRPGGTPRERIEELVGPVGMPGEAAAATHPVAPGQLKSHYAPRSPLHLCAHGHLADSGATPDGGLLFFCEQSCRAFFERRTDLARDGMAVRVLSPAGDALEAASRLFAVLHELDSLNLPALWAERAPSQGLGEAINDRLFRARVQAKE